MNYHLKESGEVLKERASSKDGLSSASAASRAEKYGKNISPGKQSPAGCRKSDP